MFLFDILFPKRCLGCGRFGYYFCHRCIIQIKYNQRNEAICPVCEKLAIGGVTHPRCRSRYTIDGLTSFFRYDGVVKKAIKQIKYGFHFDIANELVNIIPLTSHNNQLPINNYQSAIIVPIPLHPRRFRERGFNQAAMLGSALAKKLSVEVRTDILRRTLYTKPQVEMKSRKERLTNMNHVFALSPDILIPNVVFLLDDVFTTGATMRAAASVLKRAGVKFVWAITIAR